MSVLRRMLQSRLRRRRQRRRVQRIRQQNQNACGAETVSRSCNGKHKFRFINDDGEWETLEPRKTFWCIIYIKNPEVGEPYFEKMFRNRF